ncbi:MULTISPECIES: hypothetical protein [unclassified Bradyrhizobium]|uniref:hypothetical protein n=1 Tax=unclassified Bradyrhizobium TaxID=2631580 RepID=UPI00041C4D0D|nr:MULTISPECIES: hypothetical protein [unclassified Bradyrhizobium]MCP3466474.1 hypothetical protein [Bradyrhizobium sp. CCGUVB23]
MAKTPISAGDLGWIILEELRDSGDCPIGVALAVIPEPDGDWRVVIQAHSRNAMTTRCLRRIASIEKRLKAVYAVDEA